RVAMECKSVHIPRFPFRNLEEHQEQALVEFARRYQTWSLVLINFRLPHTNACYSIPIFDYLELKKIFVSDGVKSIPVDWFSTLNLHPFSGGQVKRAKFGDRYGWKMGWVLD
ncbi:unnamed protein product, partial [marine sediment metagenome]